MKMTINKLPAVLLAVATVALIVLASGLFGQAFAADDQYTVEIVPRENKYIALPGSYIDLNAVVYHDFNGDEPYDDADLDFRWELGAGDSQFATLCVDTGDKGAAYLWLKEIPEGQTDLDAFVGVTVTVYQNGKKVAAGDTVIEVSSDYYGLFSDFPNEYQMVNEETDYVANVVHYDLEHPYGEYVEVKEWVFDYDQEDPVVEITKGEATATQLPFKVKRLSAEGGIVTLTARYGDGAEDYASEVYWLERVPMDLNEYKVNLPDDLGGWLLYLPDNKPITRDYLNNNVVVNYQNVNLFPGDEIDLLVEKYDGYNEETGDYNWIVHEGDLVPAPKGSPADPNGEPTEGLALYRISAVPREGTGFTGKTEDYAQYLFLYSNKTVTEYAADITFNKSYLAYIEEEPYERYEVTEGTKLYGEVRLNGKSLSEGHDFNAVYVNDITGETSNTFPEEAGLYSFHIEGVGEYFGTSRTIAIKVGIRNNSFTANGKTIKVKIGKKKKTMKNKSFAKSKAFKVSGNQGTISYEKASGNSKITVSSAGKITVKKGLKKGKYKIKVKVIDNETEQYFATTKTVTVTVKVVK